MKETRKDRWKTKHMVGMEERQGKRDAKEGRATGRKDKKEVTNWGLRMDR